MKNFILVLLLLLSTSVFSQEFIDDTNFEEKINQRHAFGDDEFNIVIIEFYVEFNKQNAFKDWNKLTGVKYFRVDISKAPQAKKEFRVRMAPTLIIFNQGIKEAVSYTHLTLPTTD